ncbi:ovarian-specific serine/threonine-protein kinase Lok isoform X1 [Culex pipiens pallens]|uniref:ovarian-specific serine/threonine-protein kinase Lok isoform X1 n=1 Tax=Culex pipiens pallens TaxID=42434 RepID=UPI0019531FB3|nr:ovarian-specific serine/threonine-protein kinase Lok isoform X1 [Culex pipiens pallens]
MASTSATQDTQAATQTQQSGLPWSQLESQPIQQIWGRLYAKSLKITSLGTKQALPVVSPTVSENYDLCEEVFKAGRVEDNQLCIDKTHLPEKMLARISKVHFTIHKDISDLLNPVYIEDCSRNGTYLNEKLIGTGRRMILKNNDVIGLAHATYKALQFKEVSRNQDELQYLPSAIRDKYYVGKKLGSGACGVVHLIFDTVSCQPYAMKHVVKNLLVESTRPRILNEPNRVMNEVNIMKALDHPCVIKMHDIVNRPTSVCMVLEYMEGGDLLTRITSQKALSEQTSKLFFLQMCLAVQYLHAKGITHRDLKPDNILLQDSNEETLLKVSDFGLSKFVHTDSVMRTLCGTPLYVAPEVLMTGGRGTYTSKVDIWSLGVVLFTMLSGTLPFSDEYGSPATEQIKRGKFSFRHRIWRSVSAPARKLIMDILTVDPKCRPSLEQIMQSTWMRDPDVTRKAEKLMGMKVNGGAGKKPSTSSDIENNNEKVFAEPPKKRQRTK